MRFVLAASVLLGISGTSSLARSAEPPRSKVRLVVKQGEGTASCPVEPRLRRSLSRALGYDPVDPAAAEQLLVHVFRLPPSELAVYLELRDADGAVAWQRVYPYSAKDCAGLIDSATLGLEVAFQKRSTPDPEPVPTPPPPCSPTAPCPSCPPSRPCSSPPVPRDAALGWTASFGLEALFGPLPGMTGGGVLGFTYRRAWLALGLEAHISGPASIDVPEGGIQAWLYTANFAPCLRTWVLEWCAVGSFGAMRALGRGMDVPAAETFGYVGIGGRVAALVPVSDRIIMRPYLDAALPMMPIKLAIEGRDTWMTPTGAAMLGISAAFALSSPERAPSRQEPPPGGG